MDATHAKKIAGMLQQVKTLTKGSSIELDFRYHDQQLTEFSTVLLTPEPVSLRLPVHCNGNYSDTKKELVAAIEKVAKELTEHVKAIEAM